ncbi:MAG TPA: cysteine desulfurase NifS [Candidatus Methanofastidiosa archaeon]|nr:cysteine desulfurase NifS [Candidatus Methanofastidiosa archaeon]
MDKIYFDNSATTRVDEKVLKAMLPYFTEFYGNASSLHSFGRDASVAMKDSRAMVANIINADASEIIFTAGGTESDNIAIRGVAEALKEKGNHIITSSIEHPAVLETCEHLEKSGFDVSYLPVDDKGSVSLEDLEDAICQRTTLVTIMHANNEVGTIQPIREIGRIAHENGALFHTDAVQTLGKLPIDVSKDNIDLLSISGHKLHGPKGIGALYIKDGTPIEPIIFGGGHERGLRSSTENIPGIVGLGKACEMAKNDLDKDIAYMTNLRDALISGITDRIPNVKLNGHPTDRLCNNVNMSFEAIEGEALILALDRTGIAASTGSACSSKKSKASHVLMAMGLTQIEAYGSLRLSLSRMNTMQEVDYTIDSLENIVSRLRAMSPLWKEE